ncbi:ring finger domain protein [Moniliophthora roreri MCA 2997]|nr:ring finger domain protein [Moniliophthora roreri MCA 2997]
MQIPLRRHKSKSPSRSAASRPVADPFSIALALPQSQSFPAPKRNSNPSMSIITMRSSALSTEELSDQGQKLKTSRSKAVAAAVPSPSSSGLSKPPTNSKKDKGKERHSHTHTHTHAPQSSKDELSEVMGYSGPIAAAEFERMKKEIEELKGTVQEQKKTIKKQNKKIDELKGEVASAKSLKKEQENQIQALSSKVAKNDELLKSIESNLNCQICMEIMNKPFALSPCGHVLCMSCLQDWFRKAPPTLDDMDIDPEDADDPEYLKYRQKSCPCCRAIILKRPAPVFVLKSVVNAVTKHKSDSHSSTSSSQRSNSPLVGEEDPWEGLFPDEHEDDMIDEDDGYLRHYYGHDLYLEDSDSEGLESIMIEVDSDAESVEDNGEGHHHEPEELSDAESLEDPLYVKPSWEPPVGTYTREELRHLPAQKAAMLIRGGTLWMIRALHMDYSHRDGFIVYLYGLDDVGQVPYDTMYRRSAEERQKRNLHRIFLGWNIRGAREGLIEEGGKEFMNQLLDSYTNEPWRFHVDERRGGKLDVHVLVQADDCVDYDTTDTEVYY